jgi:hypothetical protein
VSNFLLLFPEWKNLLFGEQFLLLFPKWKKPVMFVVFFFDLFQTGVVHAWVGQKRLKSNILRRFGDWDPIIAFEIQMQCQYRSSICNSYTVTPPTNLYPP